MPSRESLSDAKRILLNPARRGIPEILLIGRYDYKIAQSPLRPHVHDSAFEVCFLERGKQTYLTGKGRQYQLTAGDVFLTKPGEIHGTGFLPQQPGRLFWMQFRIPPGNDSFLGLTIPETRDLFERLRRLPRHFPGDDELRAAFFALFEHRKKLSSSFERARLRSLALRIVIHLVEQTEATRPPVSHKIRLAVSHIREEIHARVNVRELAHIAGLSESHFKSRFMREVGIPPSTFARLCRLELAEKLLCSSSESVTSMAFRLGFASSQHFATVFQKYYGTCPSAYRKVSRPGCSEKVVHGEGPMFHPIAK